MYATGGADEYWSEVYANGRDYSSITTADLDYILGKLSPDAPKTALDIGCGTGQACRELFHRGYNILGIDIADEAIKMAQKSTVYLEEDIDFKKLDVETEPLPGQNYGLILCKYVYAFIKNQDEFLTKVAKALDKQGIFVIITPVKMLLPPQKQHIAVEHEEVIKSLKAFSKVNSYERNKDIYYICSK